MSAASPPTQSDRSHQIARYAFGAVCSLAMLWTVFHPDLQDKVIGALGLIAGMLGLRVNLPGFTFQGGDGSNTDSSPNVLPSLAAGMLALWSLQQPVLAATEAKTKINEPAGCWLHLADSNHNLPVWRNGHGCSSLYAPSWSCPRSNGEAVRTTHASSACGFGQTPLRAVALSMPVRSRNHRHCSEAQERRHQELRLPSSREPDSSDQRTMHNPWADCKCRVHDLGRNAPAMPESAQALLPVLRCKGNQGLPPMAGLV
jgi:hypothetical protein